jgi:hypothetical protein
MSEQAPPQSLETASEAKPEVKAEKPTKAASKETNWIANAPLFVAVVALVGFASIIAYLLSRTLAATELEWTRAVYLLNGVEAIAFAAAGFLFGKEVHRQQAESAQQLAKEAQEEAADARVTAAQSERSSIEAETKGKAVAAAVRAISSAQNGVKEADFEALGPLGERKIPSDTAKQPAPLAELRALVDELYPK